MGYGPVSQNRILTCKPLLQQFAYKLMEKVEKTNHPLLKDLTVVYGLRGKADQEEAFLGGNTTKHWPDSKHNNALLPVIPEDVSTIKDEQKSSAIDIAPYPLDWEALEKDNTPFMVLGYLGQRVIVENNWIGKIRWGGTAWIGLVDEPHWEIV